MTRYTDGSYLKENPTWHAEDSAWKLMHVQRALAAADISAGCCVCDMGCGSGELIKQWALQAPEVLFTGYDISPQAIELCKKNVPANVTFETGPCLPSGTFSLTLALDVLEHIEQEEVWLEQIAQTAPYLVLHIPLEISLYTFMRPAWLEEERKRMGHLHFYTPSAVQQLFKRHHFNILSWHYTNKYLEKPPVLTSSWSKLGMSIRKLIHLILPTRLAAFLVGGYSVMCVISRDTGNGAV